jgi:hypothetical protein
VPPDQTIALLARWVRELRIENESKTVRIHALQEQVSAFGFWMKTGCTPDVICHYAAELERVP